MTKPDKKKPAAERRKHPRLACHTFAGFAVENQNYTAFIHNVSEGGAFLGANDNIQVGDNITLSVQVTETQVIRILGQVVRIAENGVGVKFRMGVDSSVMSSIVAGKKTEKPPLEE